MKFSKYELYDLINRPGPLWLVETDLSAVCLKKIDLIEAKLERGNLAAANLTGAKLEKGDLFEAELASADLSFAKFMRGKFRKC